MAKTKTPLTKEQIIESINNLSTKEQKDLKEHIEKTLNAKAEAAANELDLIRGKAQSV